MLAGGLGTRLREVVSDVPKPMAPVHGRPFLAYQLEHLAQQGVNRIVLSVCYMSEKIIDYFGNNYSGMDIVYANEDEPLGTGGAVKLAMESCTQDHVYILNGDTYFDVDIKGMEKQWKRNKTQLLVGMKTINCSRYGALEIENGCVIGLSNNIKNSSEFINIGCYLLETSSFKKISKPKVFSFEKDFLSNCPNRNSINLFEYKGYFIDIGIPEDYIKIQEKLNNENRY